MKKEGFWYSKHEPNLPRPEQIWSDKKALHKFLVLLKHTEKKATRKCQKGASKCRICGKNNGSCTFFYKNWTWPDGLIHYVANHNIKPSREFIQFIMVQNYRVYSDPNI